MTENCPLTMEQPMSPTIQERCEQYQDGLISGRELLGLVIEILGRAWEGSSEDEPYPGEAVELINWLVR
jgi:hypothetical protein